MAILVVLANLTTSAISALFCQFGQISSSIGFDTTWVNFGDFGEFEKFDNFLRYFASPIRSSIGIYTIWVNIDKIGDYPNISKVYALVSVIRPCTIVKF